MSDWADTHALVTGASRGIGRAVAVALAGAGCRVAICGRDREALRETAHACRDAGGDDATVVVADVTDPRHDQRFSGALADFGGRLDLLANVAGSALTRARSEDLRDDDWEASMALHVVGPARLQRLSRDALASARGAIVNVGSIAANGGVPQGAAYAAAKAALVSLTRTTAVEWARDGIRANVVEPGYVATDFNAPAIDAGLEPRILAKVPTREAISPAAVARAVLYLGSPENREITGAVLRVDGGWTARL
jgi:2-deoxy-D-gluconate 3-dehydrogenase